MTTPTGSWHPETEEEFQAILFLREFGGDFLCHIQPFKEVSAHKEDPNESRVGSSPHLD